MCARQRERRAAGLHAPAARAAGAARPLPGGPRLDARTRCRAAAQRLLRRRTSVRSERARWPARACRSTRNGRPHSSASPARSTIRSTPSPTAISSATCSTPALSASCTSRAWRRRSSSSRRRSSRSRSWTTRSRSARRSCRRRRTRRSPSTCAAGRASRSDGSRRCSPSARALPLAYDSDLQEDKELAFAQVAAFEGALGATALLVGGLHFDAERMREAAADGATVATDVAEALVRGGMPFREAHEQVASRIAAGERFAEPTPEQAVAARNAPGGTSPAAGRRSARGSHVACRRDARLGHGRDGARLAVAGHGAEPQGGPRDRRGERGGARRALRHAALRVRRRHAARARARLSRRSGRPSGRARLVRLQGLLYGRRTAAVARVRLGRRRRERRRAGRRPARRHRSGSHRRARQRQDRMATSRPHSPRAAD